MWEFLWNVFRGLLGTFAFAVFLVWLGRARRISWIIYQTKRKIIAFIWAFELIGVLMYFALIGSKSIVVFAVIWMIGLIGIVVLSEKFEIEFLECATFLQIIFCWLWIPILGAIVFYLSVHVYLWWLF